MERDAALRRQQRVQAQPEWLLSSERKLHQFLRYGWKVFDLPGLLESLRDGRRDPTISTFHVASSLFFAAVLRIPSLNALEGYLKEGDFQKLIGLTSEKTTRSRLSGSSCFWRWHSPLLNSWSTNLTRTCILP